MTSMATDLLPCVELGANDAEYSVIWLHGLGANGHDFEPIVPELKLTAVEKIRFVFPHAPAQPVTINGGIVMPAWYDIASSQLDHWEDDSGIRRSQQYIEALLQRENTRGVDSEHIILAGFSQGGAIALHTGLRYPQPLAGILALSTYLPLVQTVQQEATAINLDVPIFMAHGSNDPVVPLRLGDDSRHYLQQLGYQPEWQTYFMEHSVCPDEIKDISQWLAKVLSI